MKIQITLQAHKSTHNPYVRLCINGIEYYNQQLTNKITTVEFDFTAEDTNVFEIHHYNKTNEDTICDQHGNIVEDCAIELIKIHIDGFVVPTNILYKKPFYVQWPANLIGDARIQGHQLPDTISNNLFFGFNGYYKFDFSNNFAKEYFWYQWQMERDANQNLQMVDESTQTGYFEAYGLKLAINQDFNYTITDLKYIIENQTLPTANHGSEI